MNSWVHNQFVNLPEVLKKESHNNKSVSVIVPCRNEENFIGPLIENILDQDYPKDLIEVFFIDGLSEDNTLDILKRYVSEYDNFRLVLNPKKFVPYGLNKAIKKSKQDVILRMDVHSVYPQNYISELVHHLFELDAENVGGVWDIQAGNDSNIAKSIAFTNGHVFGIGNAEYRYAEKGIRLADTVPFGCYKREVFEQIGYFDEELIRTEDDELNARLKANGGKIFLIPTVRIKYFARPNFEKMCKMFFQYGLFKPLANKKLGKVSSIRQLFPALLILGTVFGIISTLLFPAYWPLLVLPWLIYGFIAIVISLSYFIKNRKLFVAAWIPLTFLLIHSSYGFGYLKGLFYLLIGKRLGQVENSR